MLFSDRLEVWNPGELPPPLTPDSLRRPHASIPQNPLIAEKLFLAHVIERAGTGTLDMIGLCAEAGLRQPDFRQDAGSFVQTLWRPAGRIKTTAGSESGSESGSEWRSEWRSEWGPASVHQRLIRALQKGSASRSELARRIGHKSVTRALRHALADLMKTGLAAYTIPEKPNSRLQKYKLTNTSLSNRITGPEHLAEKPAKRKITPKENKKIHTKKRV